MEAFEIPSGLRKATSTRRKVLVISGAFPPYKMAESDHVLHLCRGLAEHGLDVEVVTRQGAIDDAGLPFRVHAVMRNWSWRELPRLARIAMRSSADVVFLYYIGSAFELHPMVTFVPTVIRRVLPRAVFVTQITAPFGSIPYIHSRAARMVRKAAEKTLGAATVDYNYGTLLRDSDHIIVMAPSHLKTLESNASCISAKSTLIPAPSLIVASPDTPGSRSRGREALGLAEGDFTFAYFGRLYRGKGLETLLEAFAKVRARHSNVRLAIVGGEVANHSSVGSTWRLEDVHKLSRDLGVADSVVWTGEFPWDTDMGSTYLRAADAAVLPFDLGVDVNNSSFAAVAAHGLPTITTRSPDLGAPFIDDANVLLCPPLDPASMAAQMERLLADAELRQRLRAGIEKLAREWFSWDVSIDRTLQAFNAQYPR